MPSAVSAGGSEVGGRHRRGARALVWSVLFWVAISGGLLAIVALVRGRRDLAYVPAIACGLLLYSIRLEFLVHATAS